MLTQTFFYKKLPLKTNCIIPNDNSIYLLSPFIEEMNLSDSYATYSIFDHLLNRSDILNTYLIYLKKTI